MPNYPARILSLYLIGLIFVFSVSAFSADDKLGAIQEQAIIYRDQGFQAQEKGNFEEALTCYQKAVILDPNYAMVYNDIGIIFEIIGYKEQAKDMYLKAIEVAPDYPNSYSNLAMLYEEEKDYADAIVCWVKRATLGDPDDPWAEAARRRLEDIARVFPDAYGIIGDTERRARLFGEGSLSDKFIASTGPKEKVTLFSEETIKSIPKMDNKTRALSYLNQAKENFSRGEYVLALKEATLAEYLDSSNREIGAFVEKVRKALFQ